MFTVGGGVDDFFLGHLYFPSVSNDFSKKKWDLKSVMDCPFNSLPSSLVSRKGRVGKYLRYNIHHLVLYH